ncbi:MAG: hypothetical protein FJZ38_14765 [Candidatus Rokubacteria bacterium]|nr:hypothetical protein [Candidatus Rokubacteria bacterium]
MGALLYPLTIDSRAVAALLALGLSIGTATAASAQVFLAARPNPEFTIGPLILTAAVPRDLGTVQVNLSWSLSVPRTPRAAARRSLTAVAARDRRRHRARRRGSRGGAVRRGAGGPLARE